MRTLKTLFAFAIMCLCTHAFAQEKDIVFEQITNESGRSLGFITGIVQDQTGFMWFSTRSGLYRYNGYSYKLFKKNPLDSLSLPKNDITYLYFDNNNNFWMRHYDEISAFKDEKRVFSFDSIVGKNYDIDVKIVQDKKGNYWIGPTGNGLLKYNPSTKKTNTYVCPPNTYTPEAWKKFETLLQNNKTIAEIPNPGNEIDTAVSFSINKSGFFLVGSLGEIDDRGKYDYGALYYENKLIWELSANNCMWAGSAEKNVFESYPLELKEGNYKITYKSDVSHSCAKWDGEGPNKINFCGIKLIEISSSEFNSIKSNYLSPLRDSSYIDSKMIKDLIIDNEGNFWALTEKGLERFDYKKQKFDHFPINFSELLGTDIGTGYLRIYQDKEGIFWIGSMYGLIKYDHIWGRFVVFQNQGDKKVLTSNTIHSIFEDKNSQIWIGTDRGINIYNKEQNSLVKVTADNHNRLYNDNILQIFEDKSRNIWVATAEGLNRLIKDPFTFTNLNINADNVFPASYDASANIWYALNNKISKYSRTLLTNEDFVLPNKLFNTNSFDGSPDYIISDMVINTDQNIWVATSNKVSRFSFFSRKVDFTKEVGAIIVGNDSIKNIVKRLLIGTGNKLYAFCPNGMYILNTVDLKIKSFYPFNTNYEFIDEVDLNYFKNARFDKKGNIWLRTSMGLYQYNPQLEKMELIYEFEEKFKSGPLSDGKFDFDKYGNIWFATLPYLYNLNVESLEVKKWKFDFDHDWALGNTKIGKEKVYIYGTNGLYIFNIQTEKIQYASVETGFFDNNINGLDEDNLGYLWLTGPKFLTKYDPEELKSKNFFTPNSFTSHVFVGNPQDFSVPTSEKILFTTTGFVSFYPDSINSNIPSVVIDKFTIRGKDLDLDSLIYYKKTLHLKYNQNFLGFEFAVLDYTEPSENRYRFILEGLEDEWNVVDANNRRANYSGIAPGKYHLKVIGSNNDKVWNETGAQLQIIITPPWYKTIVAYLAYIIVISYSIWLFIKIRERNLKEEKRILEQKVKERTAEIEAQKEVLAEQNEEITEQHKNITASINYARRIQAAIVPPLDQIKEVVDDYFLLWRPRDVVSGDFHWCARHENITIIVAADCTGHGVPGAFMSMLGVAFLNEIVNKEKIVKPNEILNQLRKQIINQLHQTGKDNESKDGMDLSLYAIDHNTMKLSFSGAKNSLYIIRNGILEDLKANKMPIGYYIKMTDFTQEEYQLQKGDCLYNTSDGYPDQFGGTDDRKFMTKNFKELLLKVYEKPMAEQREILNNTINEWIGKGEQTDDIIVIGVRV